MQVNMETINEELNKQHDDGLGNFEGDHADAYAQGIALGQEFALEELDTGKLDEALLGGVAMIKAMDSNYEALTGLGNESDDDQVSNVIAMAKEELSPYKVDLSTPGLEEDDKKSLKDKAKAMGGKIKDQLKKAYEWLKNLIASMGEKFKKLGAKTVAAIAGVLGSEKTLKELEALEVTEVEIPRKSILSTMIKLNTIAMNLGVSTSISKEIDATIFADKNNFIKSIKMVSPEKDAFTISDDGKSVVVDMNRAATAKVDGKDVSAVIINPMKQKVAILEDGKFTKYAETKLPVDIKESDFPEKIKVKVSTVVALYKMRGDVIKAAKEGASFKLNDTNKAHLDALGKLEGDDKDVMAKKKALTDAVALNNTCAINASFYYSSLAMMMNGLAKDTIKASKAKKEDKKDDNK